jgi:hypothetical protein
VLDVSVLRLLALRRELDDSVRLMAGAVREVRASGALRRVLELTLATGNYLNGGTNKGAPSGGQGGGEDGRVEAGGGEAGPGWLVRLGRMRRYACVVWREGCPCR